MAMKTVSMTAGEADIGRVDLIVRELLETSRSQVRGMVDHDCVSINGSRCRNIGASVEVGDVVQVRFDPHTRYREKKRKWDDRSFTVVHEDEHLIVVDKAPGVLSVPTDRGEANSLQDRISLYLSHSKSSREACLVHRLDREISGILVFAKHQKMADVLVEQFKQHRPDRCYDVLVSGIVPDDEGTIETHLTTLSNLETYAAPESSDSQVAITRYHVVKRMKETSMLSVSLQTSARHQIRVHLADAGYPVLGETRYGEVNRKKRDKKKSRRRHNHPPKPQRDGPMGPKWPKGRIAIHAGKLSFFHPITAETVEYQSKMPRAMERFLKS